MASGKGQRSQAKMEQIVSEYLVKSLQIILEARIPSIGVQKHFDSFKTFLSSSSVPRKQDQWFNLVLGNSSIPQQHIDLCKTNRQGLIVIDVLLSQTSGDHLNTSEHYRARSATASSSSSIKAGGAWPTTHAEGGHILLERWFVQFKSWNGVRKCSEGRPNTVTVDSTESPLVPNLKNECKRAETSRDKTDTGLNWNFLPHVPPQFPHVTDVAVVYKQTILMLRSLYSLTRLLPAYRLFRLSCSSPKSCLFTLSYRLSTFPLTGFNEAEMASFCITPIDTLWGQMLIKVVYNTATSVTASEVSISGSPQIITDYVGSPTTERIKKLSDEPLGGSVPTDGMSGNKIHAVCLPLSVPNSPRGSMFGLQQWWKGRLESAQSGLQRPSPSPSSGGSLLLDSNLDDSLTSVASHISDGSFESKIPHSHRNRTVSAPIPIDQNQHLHGSSNFLCSGRSPSCRNVYNSQIGSSSQTSLPDLERTTDSISTQSHRNSNIRPPVHHHLSLGGTSLPNSGSHQKAFKKSECYNLKSNMTPLPLVQHAHRLSPLCPTGESSSSYGRIMHFGSAPVNTCTSFTNLYQAAFETQNSNCDLINLGDNMKKASDLALRPEHGKKTFFTAESISKKGKEHGKEECILDDDFTFPFAIDEDKRGQKRVKNRNDGRAPAGKAERIYHRSQSSAAGELTLMLKSAAPLSRMGNVTNKADFLLSDQADSISERSRNTILKKGTVYSVPNEPRKARDALNELKSYIEMRDFLLRQSGRKQGT